MKNGKTAVEILQYTYNKILCSSKDVRVKNLMKFNSVTKR